jgi:hypothetical protein
MELLRETTNPKRQIPSTKSQTNLKHQNIIKIPNHKFQIPKKSQNSNHNPQTLWEFGLGLDLEIEFRL